MKTRLIVVYCDRLDCHDTSLNCPRMIGKLNAFRLGPANFLSSIYRRSDQLLSSVHGQFAVITERGLLAHLS